MGVANESGCGYEKWVWLMGVTNTTYTFPCIERVDVNLTPDKRSIMIHEEKVLLDLIKVSVTVWVWFLSCGWGLFVGVSGQYV